MIKISTKLEKLLENKNFTHSQLNLIQYYCIILNAGNINKNISANIDRGFNSPTLHSIAS